MEFQIGDKMYSGEEPLVMGIVNVTPDSFYEGSRYSTTTHAVKKARHMAASGTDIIDIGGESSRPGSKPVGLDEELYRVIPIVKAIHKVVDVPLSVDTYRAEVARQAIDSGAVLINDISALRFDKDMAAVIADSNASVVLMHMQGTPETMQNDPRYDDVVEEVLDFLMRRIDFAVSNGIPKKRILVDPGIGFGKTLDHNLKLLRNVERFHETGCAILIGVSRKGMIGAITGAPIEDRLSGTASITAHCVLRGVEVHRVHDVLAIRQVCDIAAVLRG
jgi:dihydropteroate synthase